MSALALVQAYDRGVAEHALADAEGAQFHGGGQIGLVGSAIGVEVVVEQRPRRGGGLRGGLLLGCEHGGVQLQRGQRRIEEQALDLGLVAHRDLGQRIQGEHIFGRAPVQAEADRAQGLHGSMQAPAAQLEALDLARVGLVEAHLQVQHLVVARVGHRRGRRRRQVEGRDRRSDQQGQQRNPRQCGRAAFSGRAARAAVDASRLHR
ncbi:hypothetical protein EA661_17985 [Pseudoxanthomonas winnipegensis]|uniref:Uncharacterized protein n=1 Tax=Pseudoxanthomonas winnipegensis TaxID=2480810 RepID=A0A4Q8L999_9GAMM|nr:hypothetical protein [Pseudoxanthomonas winnipegensis]RZZ82752.1 hypothetical protein EA662_15730 [Pseudoxanthomonas winnipegensis]TAA24957.1 hypothetical protein EA661_17985 [Pseudoxanthomonas winnipegensis]